MRLRASFGFAAFCIASGVLFASIGTAPELPGVKKKMKESVGKALFFDTGLSNPPGQSCASCHAPESHYANPKRTMIAEGALRGRFGNRRPPSLAYASFSPAFHFDAKERDYVGGYFWDGRASSLQAQARGPMLNPAEMNNTSAADVVAKVEHGPNAERLREIYGADIFARPEEALRAIADAIAAYEGTEAFHPFTSKYDYYLKGQATLTSAEKHGLKVFESPTLGNCAACHPSKPGPDGSPPLFTDFTYDNVGLPPNHKSPFLRQPRLINPDGPRYRDRGLEFTTHRRGDRGRFKVPTLRNVAETGPYFHSGTVPTLREAILFYSVRDTGRFGGPEIGSTMNRKELGRLFLTKKQIDDLEAFLRTLTDGYVPTRGPSSRPSASASSRR